MFTVKIHHPSAPPPPGQPGYIGDEEVLGNVLSVRRQYDSRPDAPLTGLHINFADGPASMLQAGRVYVMNEQGATVATYILDT